MGNIMIWSKFAYLSYLLRKEELCEFLAKSQVFTKDGKSGMVDPLDGIEKTNDLTRIGQAC